MAAPSGNAAPQTSSPTASSAEGAARAERTERAHRAAAAAADAQAKAHDARADQLSFARLGSFFVAAIALAYGISERSLVVGISGIVGFVLFGVFVVVHARVIEARDRQLVRKAIHERHLKRQAIELKGLPTGKDLIADDHVYASDIDLTGEASLFSRLDIAHTRRGQLALASWLAAPASREVIEKRQTAVAELAEQLELRVDLEAAALDAVAFTEGTQPPPLDDRPFLDFVRRPPVILGKPIAIAAMVLPIATVALWGLSGSVLPPGMWLPTFIIQAIVTARLEEKVRERHHLLVSRARFVESFRAVLGVAERATFTSPLLLELQGRLKASGKTPTAELSRLETWAGFFELRSQGLVHFLINYFVMWDVNVLLQIERWVSRAGKEVEHWFEAIGDLEALASLSNVLSQDPDAILPSIGGLDDGFSAEGLSHPLLPPSKRVANDLAIEGPGTALLVTGSNMAGKSTLLRAVGASIALALAGGPVLARTAVVPPVRLRASMRIADSLQHGSSYFHAELARLRTVVGEADASPPIFFLLDELLRGTNARARHLGARAVVLHLLKRSATGMIATHDVALSELEEELKGKVKNVHFTDVFQDGEMTFDYRLQPGVVRTSNALRLLQMAGIDVEADDKLS